VRSQSASFADSEIDSSRFFSFICVPTSVTPSYIDVEYWLKRGENEASPQQAAGYQEENLIMMRNHGFSNSSL
jgi:hypothetical protein